MLTAALQAGANWGCVGGGSAESPTAQTGREAGAIPEAGLDAAGGVALDGAGSDATAPGDGASDASLDAAKGDGAASGCWPFDQPPLATLRASPRKVFAHYFSPFPLSIDDRPPASDYYATEYLQPTGESGAHAYCGGFLRERPVSPNPWPGNVDFEQMNLESEVRRATAIGLDGFAFDVLATDPTSIHYQRLQKLLKAAPAVDPGFRVLLVADMTTSPFGGGGGSDATALAGLVALFDAFGSDPSLLRLPDGRVAFAAFAAEARSGSFWQNAISALKSGGHDVAFMPMTVGGWTYYASQFAGVPMFGAASWGVRTVTGASYLGTETAAAHGASLLFMSPVAPQDSRPKDLTYVESNNSAAFRAEWDATIQARADWVQLVTWNDYSEDSEVSPSSQTNTAFYDMSAYYIAWFKTGVQPRIVRDALYWAHRAHSMDTSVAPPNLARQRAPFQLVDGPTTPADGVELVGFLTAPGTLRITIGLKPHDQAVGVGIQSIVVPLAEGTPSFALSRGGVMVIQATSATPVSNAITYQDPLYHAGASPTCAVLF
jgi:hypothetical protein